MFSSSFCPPNKILQCSTISRECVQEKIKAMRRRETICASKTWAQYIFQHFQVPKWVEYSVFSIFESEFWILKPSQKFLTDVCPQNNFVEGSKISRECFEQKSKAIRRIETNCGSTTLAQCIFQHFQAWEWVEYFAISESHWTFFSHQADFLRNEVMCKPSRIRGGLEQVGLNNCNTFSEYLSHDHKYPSGFSKSQLPSELQNPSLDFENTPVDFQSLPTDFGLSRQNWRFFPHNLIFCSWKKLRVYEQVEFKFNLPHWFTFF